MSELLTVAGLAKSFGRKRVLEDVTFAVEPGRVYGLLGLNGEGKTTLARILMGVIPSDGGVVRFKGEPIGFSSARYKREVGFIPEDSFFYGWMKVRELLRLNSSFYPKWDADRVRALGESLGLDPNARVRTLSRGQKLKLGLVAAVGGAPDLLVLDDPTSGLDVPTRHDFLRGVIRDLAERGTAVLFASHMVHELERVADHILLLHGGRIVLNRRFDELREATRRVKLWFDGAAPEWPGVEGTLTSEPDGGRLEVVVYPWGAAAEEAARNLSPVRMEVEPLSLEDIFVAFVEAGAGRPAARS
jgi:ABC-2 type transport system ATP-binding protein